MSRAVTEPKIDSTRKKQSEPAIPLSHLINQHIISDKAVRQNDGGNFHVDPFERMKQMGRRNLFREEMIRLSLHLPPGKLKKAHRSRNAAGSPRSQKSLSRRSGVGSQGLFQPPCRMKPIILTSKETRTIAIFAIFGLLIPNGIFVYYFLTNHTLL